MSRHKLFYVVVACMLGLSCQHASAQDNLLMNGGLELPVGNTGGFESVPPFWTMEEGPSVPYQPGPYPGDYNEGGVPNVPCPMRCGAVDAADYVTWRKHFNPVAPTAFQLPNEGEGISTGLVTIGDYNFWRRHFSDPFALSLAEPSNFGHLLYEGDWYMWFQPYYGSDAEQEENFVHLYQDVEGTAGMTYTMTGAANFESFFPGGVDNLNAVENDLPTGAPFDDGDESPTDAIFALEFLDADGAVLAGSVVQDLKDDLNQPLTPFGLEQMYVEHTLSAVAPAGTEKVRVRVSMINGVGNDLPSPETFKQSFTVDDFSLTASGPAAAASVVPEPASFVFGVVAIGALATLRRRSVAERNY